MTSLAERDSHIMALTGMGRSEGDIANMLGVTLSIVRNVRKKAKLLAAARPAASEIVLTRALSSIDVGERHRKDFGDLAALARSIDANGLIQPIAVTPDGRLIAGERRLRAWPLTQFKDDPIPVHVVDLDAIVRGEWAENADRKAFTPSEIVSIKRALEPLFKEAAKKRQGARTDLRETSPHVGRETSEITVLDVRCPVCGAGAGEFCRDGEADRNVHRERAARAATMEVERKRRQRMNEVLASSGGEKVGRAADHLGAFVGKDRKTIAKMEAVVAAAEAEPEKFGKLVADMDRTGQFDGPFKRLEVIRQTEAIRKAPAPLPLQGPYQALAIDYPWPHEPDATQAEIDARGRSLRPYPAMAIETGLRFMAEEVRPILGADCIVAFWVTNFHMRHAYRLLDALGIGAEVTILTWVKDRIGRGQVLRDKSEHCIFWRIGKPVIHLTDETTVLEAPRRENSRKPEEFYALFETLVPAPRYADIFSRGGRGKNWDCHGDQVGRFDQRRAAG